MLRPFFAVFIIVVMLGSAALSVGLFLLQMGVFDLS